MASNKIIGIDLGTTNSAVAVLEATSLKLFQTRKVHGPHHQLLRSKMVSLRLVKLPSVRKLPIPTLFTQLRATWVKKVTRLTLKVRSTRPNKFLR